MNIIFDTSNIEELKNNNVLLELDTFYFSKLDKTTTAYCVVEHIKLTDFDKLDQMQKLHSQLIEAYKNKNFKLCQDLIAVLMGSFDGELDSFYSELSKRITDLDPKHLANWSPIIFRED